MADQIILKEFWYDLEDKVKQNILKNHLEMYDQFLQCNFDDVDFDVINCELLGFQTYDVRHLWNVMEQTLDQNLFEILIGFECEEVFQYCDEAYMFFFKVARRADMDFIMRVYEGYIKFTNKIKEPGMRGALQKDRLDVFQYLEELLKVDVQETGLDMMKWCMFHKAIKVGKYLFSKFKDRELMVNAIGEYNKIFKNETLTAAIMS